MGAGASIELVDDEPMTRARAQELAGDEWSELEARFDVEADVDGNVSAEKARAYAAMTSSSGGEEGAAAADDGGGGSPNSSFVATLNQGAEVTKKIFNMGNKNSMWKYMRLAAKIVTLGTVTKDDMEDDAVMAMMGMIDGNPTLDDQNLKEKIKTAAMSDEEREARHEARRLRCAKDAEEHMEKCVSQQVTL